MSELERLLTYLSSRGAKRHTIKTYMRFARKFLEEHPHPTLEDAMEFIAKHREKALLTQATCAYALRALFEANPQLGVDSGLVPLPSRVEPERKVITMPEAAIREMAEKEDVRVGAMIALMYELGLRVSEVGKITLGDLNLDEWAVYVRRSKGSISGKLPIVSDWVRALLKEYLVMRGPGPPDEPLFLGREGKGISFTRASTVVKEVLKKHGFPDARPHDIRHSRATNLLKAGVDVATVSRLLGHKSLTSTTRYLHLMVEDIRKRLEAALKSAG
jgi:site-specific recombinase XerD